MVQGVTIFTNLTDCLLLGPRLHDNAYFSLWGLVSTKVIECVLFAFAQVGDFFGGHTPICLCCQFDDP